MSFIRSFVKVILTILLVLSFFSLVLSFSFMQITSYSYLQPRLSGLIEQEFSKYTGELNEQDFLYYRQELINNCSNKSEIFLSLGDNSFGSINEVPIKCSYINENLSFNNLLSLVSKSIVDEIYYKQYNTSIQNLGDPNDMASLASKQTNDIFKMYTIILLAISILFILGIILLSKPKYTVFYNFAPAFMISGLPYFASFLIKNSLSGKLSASPDSIKNLIFSLINSVFITYLILFILGCVFLILAIVFKITKGKKKK